MRVTPVSMFLAALFAAAAPAPAAAEDAESEAENLQTLARESYDLGDYEEAQSQLEEAIERLDEAGMARGGRAVEVRMLLAAALAGQGDTGAATEQFAEALRIDPEASLGEGLATEELEALLTAARNKVSPECDSLKGLHHERVTSAPEGRAVPLRCKVGAGLSDYQLKIFYRGAGDAEFQSVAMEQGEDCTRVGQIPAEAVEGERVRYYLAALTEDGKIAATEGRADAPFSVAIRAAAPEPGEEGSPETENEVPEHLRGSQSKKGGSCAGCGAGGGSAGGALIPLLLAAALLVRRRAS